MSILARLFGVVVLFLATAASGAEKPAWVEAMKALNAGFQGNPGYVAQFGDSITYSNAFWTPIGWDEPDAYLTTVDGLPKRPKEKRWRDTLKGFGAKGPDQGNYSGWRVADVLRAMDGVLKREQPEAAIIMVGTNDISGGKVPADYRAGLMRIVAKCLAAHCVPILSTIPPRRDHDAAVEAANRIIREVATEGKIPLVDYHVECLRRQPGHAWDKTLISEDGVHPSGGKTNVYTEENLKTCGYALRNWVTFLVVRQVYFHVLAAPKKSVQPTSRFEPIRQGIRCELTADTQVSSYRDSKTNEQQWNWGKAPRLKVKGHEEYLLLKFDLARCKGMTIDRATLYLSRTEQCVVDVVAPSTVSADWVEGNGLGSAGPATGGVTFSHSVYPDQSWAGPGSDFKHVVFGEGGSSYEARPTSLAKDTKGEYYAVELPSAVIHGMLVDGDSYGLALTDEKGQRGFQKAYRHVPNPNHYFFARESGKPSFLVVEGKRDDRTAPDAIRNASAAPGDEAGQILLRWTATGDNGLAGGRALGYRVYLSEEPLTPAELTPEHLLPRWRTFRPVEPGENQVFPLDGLKPGIEYHFMVFAYDKAGNVSPGTAIRGKTRAERKLAIRPCPATDTPAKAKNNEKLRVWAEPSNAKIDPLSGNCMIKDRYAARPSGAPPCPANSVFLGKNPRVELAAGRNDFVGFQLAIENLGKEPLAGIEVRLQDLAPLSGKDKSAAAGIPAKHATIEWEWSVRDKAGAWYPDALIPHREPLSIPNRENAIPGQRVQAFYVDLWVPHATLPGDYSGQIVVRASGEAEIVLPIRLTVWGFTLPDTLNFICDMNGYGYPRQKTWEGALNLHRLAHRHRLSVNMVPYSHSANWTVPQMEMTVEGRGDAMHIVSFENFDRHFGPLLSGRAFADSPRAGVPIPVMYLPLFENWPCRLKDGFTFDQSASHVDVTSDFSDEYRRGYVAVCRQLAKHFRTEGYDRTAFQAYMNNKYHLAPELTYWLLDEPMFRDDYLVLQMFSRLTREGFRQAAPVEVDFRVDCSRAEEVHGTFDNVDLFVGSMSNVRAYRRMVEDQRHCYVRKTEGRPRKCWVYGGTSRPHEPLVANRAWAIEAFLAGFDGIVPWLAYGEDAAWTSAEAAENAVFLPAAKRWGYDGCYGSLRMKAFRDGQQDAEYLRLLGEKLGVTRGDLAAALASRLKTRANVHQSGAEQAENLKYDQLSPDDLVEFRRLIGHNLHQVR